MKITIAKLNDKEYRSLVDYLSSIPLVESTSGSYQKTRFASINEGRVSGMPPVYEGLEISVNGVEVPGVSNKEKIAFLTGLAKVLFTDEGRK